jgi:hypothetical protein
MRLEPKLIKPNAVPKIPNPNAVHINRLKPSSSENSEAVLLAVTDEAHKVFDFDGFWLTNSLSE